MKLVKDLGERYLWVDSLCLVQDDEKELAECTRMMDKYYAMAILTIVAASGTDAYAGLPGVHPTPRKSTRLVKQVLPGIWMTTMEDLDMFLRRSYYSRRGWTMQEEVCSCRLLVFINNQVYFRCQNGTCNEDAATGDLLGSYEGDLASMPGILAEPVSFDDFINLMLYYPRRELTYQSDILRACLGMLRKLADSMGEKLVEGLPTPLERSLLFSRLEPKDQPGLRRQGFPSYSWTGWKYIPIWEMEMDPNPPRGLPKTSIDAKRTWITWYNRSLDGKLCKINEQENQEPSPSDMLLDIKEGLANEFPTLISTAEASHNLNQLPDLAYDILCFRTLSIFLKISFAQSSADSQCRSRCVAYGSEETSFGEFRLDADDIEVDTIQEFALISAWEDVWKDSVETGLWGILLKKMGPLAERRGILKIPGGIMNKALPPGPMWTCIALG